MNKRKLLTIAMSLSMVAILAVGATIAYFTDTDKATNTFTVGNVSIDLIEKQRGDEGLEDFKQNKKLYPIVGSAQGEQDALGMPTAENYVDKVVTIKNDGTEDAYIRAYFAIPSALDDGYDTFNAGLNTLHFNFGNAQNEAGNWYTTYGNEWLWKQTNGKWNYFETTIGDIKYNVYFADYATTVAADATTERFVQGVYLDKSFEMKDDGAYAFDKKLTLDEKWNWSKVECPVFAVAVQAAGFDSAAEAVEAAFGAQYNPWGGAVTNWQ